MKIGYLGNFKIQSKYIELLMATDVDRSNVISDKLFGIGQYVSGVSIQSYLLLRLPTAGQAI